MQARVYKHISASCKHPKTMRPKSNVSGEPFTHCCALRLVMKDVVEAGFMLSHVDEEPRQRVYNYVKRITPVGDFTITVTVPDVGYPRVWSTRINKNHAIVSSAAKWRAQLRALQPWSPVQPAIVPSAEENSLEDLIDSMSDRDLVMDDGEIASPVVEESAERESSPEKAPSVVEISDDSQDCSSAGSSLDY